MNCDTTKSLFSSYVDGAISGREMQQVSEHLAGCGACEQEYRSYSQVQSMVATLGKKKAPPELAYRLRVAIKLERSRKQRHSFDGLRIRLTNALNAFMLPATAGVLTAVIMVGTFFGYFAMPQVADDVPTTLYTPPKLTAAPELIGIDVPVVVEASVGTDGRVQDYRIVEGPADSEALRSRLDNALIFTTFEPARAFGQPATGKVIISFANVNVKG